ncbi:ornithine cyclodeaminase family protein [bacterium]|nr:ornithine cyclodeaminase family protein [bacterium]|tara:strand:- start:408 stop:1346 length:939 start_codon:yes stop_codon:yes gene_type:complete
MSKPAYITDQDILKKITPADAIRITKQAFVDYEAKRNKMPEKIYLDLPEYNGDFRAMPAYVPRYNIAGIKWVNSHKENPALGLPSVMATLLINNPKTGELIAMMDATALTCLRTGAVGAIATELLTKIENPNIAFIGCGKQAEYQLKCIQEVKKINHINVYDRSNNQSEIFAKNIKHNLGELRIRESVKAACQTANIIITTTPGTKAIVMKDDIPERCLIIAIGADAEGKQELDHSIIMDATLIVDDITQASHSGELNTAITLKKIKRNNISATLGDLLSGKKITDNNRIVVDSTGLAIQDLALAGFYLSKV